MIYTKVNNVSNPMMAQTIKPTGCTCMELSHGAHLTKSSYGSWWYGDSVKTASLQCSPQLYKGIAARYVLYFGMLCFTIPAMPLTESANPSSFSRQHTVVPQSTAATGPVRVRSISAIFSSSREACLRRVSLL